MVDNDKQPGSIAGLMILATAMAWSGCIAVQTFGAPGGGRESSASPDSPPGGDDAGPPPRRGGRDQDGPPANRGEGHEKAGRRPPGPAGVKQAIDDLQLTDEQRKKVDPIVDEFRKKQRKIHEEFLQKMKEVLTADQYEQLEAATRPPGSPREASPKARDASPKPPEDSPNSTDAPPKPPGASPKAPGTPHAAETPSPATAKDGTQHVPVTFTGGYETDPRDHGRPVVLIAAALNVPEQVFRDAFSHVTPASGGNEPEPAQVRKNKSALLHNLGPHGVTNDRLDTVSNYYRYSASRGQMWRNTPAAAYATVRNGIVTGFTLTNPGAGYSSPPKVSVEGMADVNATAVLNFSTDFEKNGSIKQITLNNAK